MRMNLKPTMSLSLAAVLAGALTVSGCATKKYVRQQVSPVTDRVTTVENTTKQHGSTISEIENNLSRTDERAQEANKNALAAGQSADKANQAATSAGQRADEARNMAQQNTTQITELRTDVTNRIENIDNFRMVNNDAVLFRLNSAVLTKDAQEKLDQLAQNMTNLRRYVVEIEGYTDRSGSRAYNLALSQRRADAVVRYLLTKHNVPLRNIRVIGLGAEAPLSASAAAAGAGAANTADRANDRTTTKMSRKDARRVEVKVFGPDMGGQQQQPVQSRNANPGA